jgi:Ca2+-binding EF-hand superfamily protein
MGFWRITPLGIGAVGALAAALLAGPAGAQDTPGDAPQQVFVSPSGQPFRAPLDKPYPVAAWFAAADADHDGKLTKAEFRADAEAFFHVLDLNKDGVLEQPEVSRYEHMVAPEIIAGFTPDSLGQDAAPSGDDVSAPKKDEPQGAAWFSFMGEPEPVSAADGNFDGLVTLAEFQKATDERFALLDVNHKGYITLAQLPDTPVQANLKRQHRRRR